MRKPTLLIAPLCKYRRRIVEKGFIIVQKMVMLVFLVCCSLFGMEKSKVKSFQADPYNYGEMFIIKKRLLRNAILSKNLNLVDRMLNDEVDVEEIGACF